MILHNFEQSTLWLPRPRRLHLPSRPSLIVARDLPFNKPHYDQRKLKTAASNRHVRLWPLSSSERSIEAVLDEFEEIQLTQTVKQRTSTVSQSVSELIEPLKSREIDILRLIASGCTNQEIAEQLHLSVGTVKWYINQLYGKLQVRRRTEAVMRARELGILL